MATGTVLDLVGRLQRWLPTRWFPTQAVNTDGSVPRIYAILTGAASALVNVWNWIVYATAQTRIATATDGWLDLCSRDFLGNWLPRNPGELDPAFSARIRANLFLPANTRSAIQNALQKLTGYPVRMIEPFQPNDTAGWGRSFWGVNTAASPGNWSNGNLRYQGFIQCVLPTVATIGNTPFYGWGQGFWSTTIGWFQNQVVPAAGGAALVYALISRLKVKGTLIWVQFVPPSAVASVLTTDDGGSILTSDDGTKILTS